MRLFHQLVLSCLLGTLGIEGLVFAKDKLIIISPHRKSLQQEFIPMFEDYYKKNFKTEVEIDWIDQGGTSDDIRFVKAKFAKNPKSSGIDLFWGGGAITFVDLANDKLLETYKLPKELQAELPAEAAGVGLHDKNGRWYGTAVSTFGIFANRKVLKLEGLDSPKSWDDLAAPKFANMISLTDPRRSGTATIMDTVVVESKGWEKGWQSLASIAGNTRSFTQMSSDPIKAVVSGDAAAAMAIDFYAYAKIADLGKDNLEFIMPEGQTILDPDPVAILKGAPNQKAAKRFIDFILSVDAQKVLMLAKGQPGGPKLNILGRMAVNSKAYDETEGKRIVDLNPFKQKAYLKMDIADVAKYNQVFNDLFGAVIVDTHKELKEAWTAINKKKAQEKFLAEFSKMPLSEKEFKDLEKKWSDEVFRNKKINEWVNFAKEKYKRVAKEALSH